MIGRGYWWTAFLLGVCALVSGIGFAAAQDDEEDREAAIKAAYLYNFAVYSQWPKNAAGADKEKFYVGVLGKGTLNSPLKKLAASKMVQGKPLVVQHFQSIADYKPCQILFIAADGASDKKDSAEDRLAAALKKTNGTPVLIVSESEGLALKGAAINFFIEENVVRFEVNLDAVKEAGVEISSKVLRLGKVVSRSKK
jgi:hypothetical protein